jgi:hypothetical protein
VYIFVILPYHIFLITLCLHFYPPSFILFLCLFIFFTILLHFVFLLCVSLSLWLFLYSSLHVHYFSHFFFSSLFFFYLIYVSIHFFASFPLSFCNNFSFSLFPSYTSTFGCGQRDGRNPKDHSISQLDAFCIHIHEVYLVDIPSNAIRCMKKTRNHLK